MSKTISNKNISANVGNYSKGVVTVYDKLKNTGHNKIDLKLWPGLRHEILNEKSNKEVYEYINDYALRLKKGMEEIIHKYNLPCHVQQCGSLLL